MSKYVPVYRCLICNELVRCGNPVEVPDSELHNLVSIVIKQQTFRSNPYLDTIPKELRHVCIDGSSGLATFAGFKKV